MYFLVFIGAFIIVYIGSFKENFTQEKIQKVMPILVIGSFIIIILSVLSSLSSSR